MPVRGERVRISMALPGVADALQSDLKIGPALSRRRSSLAGRGSAARQAGCRWQPSAER